MWGGGQRDKADFNVTCNVAENIYSLPNWRSWKLINYNFKLFIEFLVLSVLRTQINMTPTENGLKSPSQSKTGVTITNLILIT